MKEFKITFRRQFEHIRPLILLLFWGYIIVMGMIYIFGQSDWPIYFRYALIWYIVPNFIPQIILHLRYYFLNKGYTLLYDPTKEQITINKKTISTNFTLDDISSIKHYQSFPYAENRTKWLPFDGYNYTIFYFKNGDRFIITSLMVKNLDLPIDANKQELKKVFYAYPIMGNINHNE